jgi:hypothetical protein
VKLINASWRALIPSTPRGYDFAGLWRRLVARSLGVGEVASSNLVSPIDYDPPPVRVKLK